MTTAAQNFPTSITPFGSGGPTTTADPADAAGNTGDDSASASVDSTVVDSSSVVVAPIVVGATTVAAKRSACSAAYRNESQSHSQKSYNSFVFSKQQKTRRDNNNASAVPPPPPASAANAAEMSEQSTGGTCVANNAPAPQTCSGTPNSHHHDSDCGSSSGLGGTNNCSSDSSMMLDSESRDSGGGSCAGAADVAVIGIHQAHHPHHPNQHTQHHKALETAATLTAASVLNTHHHYPHHHSHNHQASSGGSSSGGASLVHPISLPMSFQVMMNANNAAAAAAGPLTPLVAADSRACPPGSIVSAAMMHSSAGGGITSLPQQQQLMCPSTSFVGGGGVSAPPPPPPQMMHPAVMPMYCARIPHPHHTAGGDMSPMHAAVAAAASQQQQIPTPGDLELSGGGTKTTPPAATWNASIPPPIPPNLRSFYTMSYEAAAIAAAAIAAGYQVSCGTDRWQGAPVDRDDGVSTTTAAAGSTGKGGGSTGATSSDAVSTSNTYNANSNENGANNNNNNNGGDETPPTSANNSGGGSGSLPPGIPPSIAAQLMRGHDLFVHILPGDAISLAVGKEIQHIHGPATIRMVSPSAPPSAIPMNVPRGHLVHQLLDKNGMLSHIIMSKESHPGASPASIASSTISPAQKPAAGLRAVADGASPKLPSSSPPLTAGAPAPQMYAMPPPAIGAAAAGGATFSPSPQSQPGAAVMSQPQAGGLVKSTSPMMIASYPPMFPAGSDFLVDPNIIHLATTFAQQPHLHQIQAAVAGAPQRKWIMPPNFGASSPIKREGGAHTAAVVAAGFSQSSYAPPSDQIHAAFASNAENESNNYGIEDDERERLFEALNTVQAPRIVRLGAYEATISWQELDTSEAAAPGGPFPQIDASEFVYEIYVYDSRQPMHCLMHHRCTSSTSSAQGTAGNVATAASAATPAITSGSAPASSGSAAVVATSAAAEQISSISPNNKFVLTGLRPATDYLVNIRASLPERELYGNVSSQVAFRTANSFPDAPLPPRVLQRHSQTAFTIGWCAPSANGCAIISFLLQVAKNKSDHFETVYEGIQEYWRSVGLEPNAYYKLRVLARNEIGCSEPSAPLAINTSAMSAIGVMPGVAASAAGIAVSAAGTSPNALQIAHRAQAPPPQAALHHHLAYSPHQQPQPPHPYHPQQQQHHHPSQLAVHLHHHQQQQQQQQQSLIQHQQQQPQPQQQTQTQQNTVAAQKKRCGAQKPSPPTVHSVSARSVRLSWTSINEFQTVILEMCDFARSNSGTYSPVADECYANSGTYANVGGLQSNREYRFRLAGVTLAGETLRSDYVSVKTYKDRYENSALYNTQQSSTQSQGQRQSGYLHAHLSQQQQAQEKEIRIPIPVQLQRLYDDERTVEISWRYPGRDFDNISFVVEGCSAIHPGQLPATAVDGTPIVASSTAVADATPTPRRTNVWRVCYRGSATTAAIQDMYLSAFRVQAVNQRRQAFSTWSEVLFVKRMIHQKRNQQRLSAQQDMRQQGTRPALVKPRAHSFAHHTPQQHVLRIGEEEEVGLMYHTQQHSQPVAHGQIQAHYHGQQHGAKLQTQNNNKRFENQREAVAEPEDQDELDQEAGSKHDEPTSSQQPPPSLAPRAPSCLAPKFMNVTPNATRVTWRVISPKADEPKSEFIFELQRIDRQPPIIVYSGNECEYALENLKPAEHLQIRVRAVLLDADGQRTEGEWSAVGSACTLCDVPSAPTNLRVAQKASPAKTGVSSSASSSTASITASSPVHITAKSTVQSSAPALTDASGGIWLEWDAPAQLNGSSITEYSIFASRYTTKHESNTDANDDANEYIALVAENERVGASASAQFQVVSLAPAHRYVFRVRAMNEAGASPASNPLEVISAAGVPDAPRQLHVEPLSDALIFTWTAGRANGAKLLDYWITVIKLTPVDGTKHHHHSRETIGEFTVDADENSFQVEELETETNYELMICARNSIGRGASEKIRCKTLEPPPEPPVLTVVNAASNALKLKWLSAKDAMYYYQLEKENETGTFSRVYEGELHSTKVKNLREHSAHHFRVRAALARNHVVGEWSPVYEFHTTRQPPPSLKNAPVINEVEPGLFQADWQPIRCAATAAAVATTSVTGAASDASADTVANSRSCVLYRLQITSKLARDKTTAAADPWRTVYEGSATTCTLTLDVTPPPFSRHARIIVVQKWWYDSDETTVEECVSSASPVVVFPAAATNAGVVAVGGAPLTAGGRAAAAVVASEVSPRKRGKMPVNGLNAANASVLSKAPAPPPGATVANRVSLYRRMRRMLIWLKRAISEKDCALFVLVMFVIAAVSISVILNTYFLR